MLDDTRADVSEYTQTNLCTHTLLFLSEFTTMTRGMQKFVIIFKDNKNIQETFTIAYDKRKVNNGQTRFCFETDW